MCACVSRREVFKWVLVSVRACDDAEMAMLVGKINNEDDLLAPQHGICLPNR